MERETLYDSPIDRLASGPDIMTDDTEEVKEVERRLKRNSTLITVAGILTVIAGGVLLGGLNDLIPGFLGELAEVVTALGIGAFAFGAVSFFKNIYRKKSLSFPGLKWKRKTTGNFTGEASRHFAETGWEPRRLTKNPSNRMLFGVCGGLADYAGVSPGLMRIAFVLAALFSTGVIIIPYIVLAFVLPALKRREEA